jgi:hypothetical protein
VVRTKCGGSFPFDYAQGQNDNLLLSDTFCFENAQI